MNVKFNLNKSDNNTSKSNLQLTKKTSPLSNHYAITSCAALGCLLLIGGIALLFINRIPLSNKIRQAIAYLLIVVGTFLLLCSITIKIKQKSVGKIAQEKLFKKTELARDIRQEELDQTTANNHSLTSLNNTFKKQLDDSLYLWESTINVLENTIIKNSPELSLKYNISIPKEYVKGIETIETVKEKLLELFLGIDGLEKIVTKNEPEAYKNSSSIGEMSQIGTINIVREKLLRVYAANERLESELTNVQKKYNSAQETLGQLNEMYEKLQDNSALREECNTTIQQHLLSTHEKLVSKTIQLSNINKQLNQDIENLNEKLKENTNNLESEKVYNQTQITKLSTNITALKTEMAMEKNNIEQLETLKHDLLKKNQDLKEQISLLKNTRKSLVSRNDDLTRQAEEAKTKEQEIRSLNEQLQHDSTRLKEHNMDMLKNIKKQRSQIKLLQEQLSDQEDKMEELGIKDTKK